MKAKFSDFRETSKNRNYRRAFAWSAKGEWKHSNRRIEERAATFNRYGRIIMAVVKVLNNLLRKIGLIKDPSLPPTKKDSFRVEV
jgi:hypothetical protein